MVRLGKAGYPVERKAVSRGRVETAAQTQIRREQEWEGLSTTHNGREQW